MRQAGRSLPEYRAIRGSGSILDAIHDPELAAEITLQPVRRYGVDAAILYSDIVVPVAAIGFGVDVGPGRRPGRRAARSRGPSRPRPPAPARPRGRHALRARDRAHPGAEELPVPLIGFAGAPFTVASYLVEGRPSRTYATTKALMFGDPGLWHQLLERLADLAIASLRAQVADGARPSSCSTPGPAPWPRPTTSASCCPHSTRVFDAVADLGVPRIHFGVGTGELLGLMAAAGADVVGVDWRVPLDVARHAGAGRPGRCRATSTRRWWRPRGRSSPRPCATSCAATPATPATCSTSATACCPRPTPRVLERVVELVHAEGRCDATVAADEPATSPDLGLVVMAYGTPRTPAEIEPYYTHIRRGRPPTPELLADLTARYDAIGGISPLAQRTEAQRAALEAALEERMPGRWKVVLGQKHAAPFIEDAVADARRRRHRPRRSGSCWHPTTRASASASTSAGPPRRGESRGIRFHAIDRWHLEPAYLDFLADAVREAAATLPADHKVLFTAHSLPERVLVDDPYPDELRERAAAVAERVGLSPWPDWALAWQSAGRTPEPWRGPDILEVLRDLGATGRTEGVLVCAQGFTADHLEVLYDLDIEATRVADEVGLAFARTRSLNDDPAVMAALADKVVATAAAAGVD